MASHHPPALKSNLHTLSAPPQILPQERSFAVAFALVFFVFLSLPLWGSVLIPAALPSIVLLLDLYWTVQVLIGAWSGWLSYRRLLGWRGVDWLAGYLTAGRTVRHVIAIPNYNERPELLRATLAHLALQRYPIDQLCIVLASEERERGALAKSLALRDEFASLFGRFWVTVHPLVPGETAWKGANLAFSMRQVWKHCESLGWDPGDVLVTTLDADARLDAQYLAALSVQHLGAPAGSSHFFQGLLTLTNNLWQVEPLIRAFSAFWTFAYVSGASHYARMTTAVYSAPLELLDRIGYWDPRVLVEDGHIFFRAFFSLGGAVDVIPIYLPVGLDAIGAQGLGPAIRAQYRQMTRWAWTVSNLPYLAHQMLEHSEIRWPRKLARGLPYIESLLLLPASWFVISFGVILPPLLNPAYRGVVLGLPLAPLSGLILAPTVLGLIAGIVINTKLRRLLLQPHLRSGWAHLWMWSEWLLLPLAAILYFSLPYIQAYWRLLRGRNLLFDPTPK